MRVSFHRPGSCRPDNFSGGGGVGGKDTPAEPWRNGFRPFPMRGCWFSHPLNAIFIQPTAWSSLERPLQNRCPHRKLSPRSPLRLACHAGESTVGKCRRIGHQGIRVDAAKLGVVSIQNVVPSICYSTKKNAFRGGPHLGRQGTPQGGGSVLGFGSDPALSVPEGCCATTHPKSRHPPSRPVFCSLHSPRDPPAILDMALASGGGA